MKNIIYCSSVQKDLFTSNTRSLFQNYIDIDNLDHLPKGEIEVAVKKIIFDTDIITNHKKTLIFNNERVSENPVFGLKSNICKESIFNNDYEKILCMFPCENIFHVEFKKPSFFETNKELLSNAKFIIINLKTNEQPEWGEGSPTFIHLLIRKRMSKTFNIFVESNNVTSMVKFPKNTNMEFTIDLPERFRLGDWQVCLKSLIMPSRIWNVYDETRPKWMFQTNTDLEDELVEFQIPQGSYEVVDIILIIQRYMDALKIPLLIYLNDDKNRVTLKLKNRNIGKNDIYTLFFNGYLSKILGFSINDEKRRFNVTKRYRMYEANYAPNIHAYTPKSIIVTSDIVEDTIFGGERLKLLRLITNKMERIGDTVHYDFLHDEYVDLRTHEFERIKIRISDVTGNLLSVDYPEIETRLQLEFKEKQR